MLMVSGGPTLGQAAAEELAATKAKTAQEKADRLEAQNARSDARRKRQAEREGSDLIEARSFCWFSISKGWRDNYRYRLE